MSAKSAVVFLVDVYNTLLDNDRITADLKGHLEREVGHEREERYLAIFAAPSRLYSSLLNDGQPSSVMTNGILASPCLRITARRTDLPLELRKKMLDINPRRCYGIPMDFKPADKAAREALVGAK